MARVGIRNTAAPKQLPEMVQWATHVPIVLIPSGGHSRLAEGTEIATGPEGRQRRQGVERRTPNGRRETQVRLRYQPCCERHMEEVEREGVKALIGLAQLQALANRLSQQQGHGALRPSSAAIEWQACTDQVLCHACIVEQCEELGIPLRYGNKDDGRHQFTDAQLMGQIEEARLALSAAKAGA